HLLVEEQIRAFVDERLHNKAALIKAKLDCHQAICLAEALSNEELHPNVWEAARKLNNLRNHIAHTLEPIGLIDRIDHISSLIGLPPERPTSSAKLPGGAVIDNLSFAVSLLYNEISLSVKRKPALALSIVQDASGV
ncbi:MAG: hypothetical protein ABIP34_06335, partial [Rhodoferax sp.]|uniref:hypothetical protein n=1 Tax=Rhodoferax sp. TaxID=50421 RepID=UPI003264E5FE